MFFKSVLQCNSQDRDMTVSAFRRRRLYRMSLIRQTFLCHVLVLCTIVALSAEPALSQNDDCTNARLQECLQHAKKFEEDSKLLTLPGNQQHYINSLNKSCRSLMKALKCFPPLSKCENLNERYDIGKLNTAVEDQVSIFCELTQFTQTNDYLDHQQCIDKSLGDAFECLIEYIKDAPVSDSDATHTVKSCCARTQKLACYERTLVKKCHYVPINYQFLEQDRDFIRTRCSNVECPRQKSGVSTIERITVVTLIISLLGSLL